MIKFLVTGAAAALGIVSTALPGGIASYASPTQSTTAKPAQPASNPDELDRLLAPIALYPDALLAQILMCASNPGRIGALDEEGLEQANARGHAAAFVGRARS